MRFHPMLPLQCRENAIDIANFSYKKWPSSSFYSGILEETCTCKKVNYSFLKNFGCEAFVHINKESRRSL